MIQDFITFIIKAINLLDSAMIFFTFIIVLYNLLYRDRRMSQDINIILDCNDPPTQKKLNLSVKRRHCTRAEIFGIIGASLDKSESGFYDIPYMSTEKFSNQLVLAQKVFSWKSFLSFNKKPDITSLHILCSNEVIKAFDKQQKKINAEETAKAKFLGTSNEKKPQPEKESADQEQTS